MNITFCNHIKFLIIIKLYLNANKIKIEFKNIDLMIFSELTISAGSSFKKKHRQGMNSHNDANQILLTY